MKKMTFQLETLTCPSCVNKIEKALKKTKGVEDVNVLFTSSKVKIEFDENTVTEDDLSYVITRLGFAVLKKD